MRVTTTLELLIDENMSKETHNSLCVDSIRALKNCDTECNNRLMQLFCRKMFPSSHTHRFINARGAKSSNVLQRSLIVHNNPYDSPLIIYPIMLLEYNAAAYTHSHTLLEVEWNTCSSVMKKNHKGCSFEGIDLALCSKGTRFRAFAFK